MQDIPVYFQGQWERMCGRTLSRILPIHIGVMQKRFETVRLLLDLGADPNKFGVSSLGWRTMSGVMSFGDAWQLIPSSLSPVSLATLRD
jgi:hypothetical protein